LTHHHRIPCRHYAFFYRLAAIENAVLPRRAGTSVGESVTPDHPVVLAAVYADADCTSTGQRSAQVWVDPRVAFDESQTSVGTYVPHPSPAIVVPAAFQVALAHQLDRFFDTGGAQLFVEVLSTTSRQGRSEAWCNSAGQLFGNLAETSDSSGTRSSKNTASAGLNWRSTR
jgi:hypothetical protein